jgi:hypothetical protein
MKEHRITLGREDTLVIETNEGFIEICRDARPRMKHHLIITTPDDSALVKSKETDFTGRISGMRGLRYHEVKENRVCLKNLSRHTVFRIKGISDGTGKRVGRDPVMAAVADR